MFLEAWQKRYPSGKERTGTRTGDIECVVRLVYPNIDINGLGPFQKDSIKSMSLVDVQWRPEFEGAWFGQNVTLVHGGDASPKK